MLEELDIYESAESASSAETEFRVRDILCVPRLKVSHACVSGSLHNGFPSLTAFNGLAHALERKLSEKGVEGLRIDGVGVVCHDSHQYSGHEIKDNGKRDFRRSIYMPRGTASTRGVSSSKAAETPPIIPESKADLDLTILFSLNSDSLTESQREHVVALTRKIFDSGKLRVAGGTVMGTRESISDLERMPVRETVRIVTLPDDDQERHSVHRKLTYQLLPGFILIDRSDLLSFAAEKAEERGEREPVVEGLVDLFTLEQRPEPVFKKQTKEQIEAGEKPEIDHYAWPTRRKIDVPGYLAAIQVGFSGISPLNDAPHPGARNPCAPHRFVEDILSVGEWVAPFRIKRPEGLFWCDQSDADNGVYRMRNMGRKAT